MTSFLRKIKFIVYVEAKFINRLETVYLFAKV